MKGKECTCHARCEWECSCTGVDWRSDREVELETEVKELQDLNKVLFAEIPKDYPEDHDCIDKKE